MQKVRSWRDHYESNFRAKHEEYFRIVNGIHAHSDKMRASERSKIVSPATAQAVESSIAEIEEATFGTGKWFDIEDDWQDQDSKDIQVLRKNLQEDMKYARTKQALAEVIQIAATYGTGVAELVVDYKKSYKPATRQIEDTGLAEVGVETTDKFYCKIRPILPQNFLIDPNAAEIDESLGVAIDEFVPKHQVEQLIVDGVYRNVPVSSASPDDDIEPDQDLAYYNSDRVRVTRYYGLVPKYMLEKELNSSGEEEDDLEADEEADSDNFMDATQAQEYVEAILVIMNNGVILKAEESPYMMKDRPVVGFAWEKVPGRFWGRGVVDKAYNSQKALDAEMRSRIDALALLIHPMIAADATGLPRGTDLTVSPGKILLTNGPPSQVLEPFKMGSLEQLSFSQSAELMKMVQMATGAIESSGLPQAVAGGNVKSGAMSMSFGAIIKRHKRTLLNFQENLLIPLITKVAWRYMQFDSDRYPVKDFKFCPTTSLGIMAREIETNQLVSLLQTTNQESPFYPLILEKIVENMQVSNRDELTAKIREMAQPDPDAQKAKQQQQQAEMMKYQAELRDLQAGTKKTQAEIRKILTETQLLPQEAQAKLVSALSTNIKKGEGDDKEFERRYKIADLMLKEKDMASNERIVDKQLAVKREQQNKGGGNGE